MSLHTHTTNRVDHVKCHNFPGIYYGEEILFECFKIHRDFLCDIYEVARVCRISSLLIFFNGMTCEILPIIDVFQPCKM